MLRKILLCASVIVFSGSTQASDFQSARVAALGGASHAGPLLNDSIILNPSYSSFLPTYATSFNYLPYNGNGDSSFHGRNYQISVQDGRSELFQAGVAYTQREGGSMVNVGASHQVVRRLGFGIGAKFFFNDINHTSGRDASLSTTFVPMDKLQAAFIADNVLDSEAAKERGLRREYILGLKYNLQNIVLIYFDPHWVPDLGGPYGHETGLEFPFASDFFLRMGTFHNAMVPYEESYGRGYGIGVGWVAPRLSLDYAIQRVIEPVAATAHIFGATAFF